MSEASKLLRKDGRFKRINQVTVNLLRRDKEEGFSLNEIAKKYNISKFTASIYTRDIFYFPGRKYGTEEEFREAIYLRTVGKNHHKYHPCVDCGNKIQNENMRCEDCHVKYLEESGKLKLFIESGINTRFGGKP